MTKSSDQVKGASGLPQGSGGTLTTRTMPTQLAKLELFDADVYAISKGISQLRYFTIGAKDEMDKTEDAGYSVNDLAASEVKPDFGDAGVDTDVDAITHGMSKLNLSVETSEDELKLENEVSQTTDPAYALNDKCIFCILSFLSPREAPDDATKQCPGNGNAEENGDSAEDEAAPPVTVCVVEVAKFYYTFASLSRAWKAILDDVIVRLVGLVNIGVSNTARDRLKGLFWWTGNRKCRVGSIDGIFPVTLASDELVSDWEKMMCECDTSQMSLISVCLVQRFSVARVKTNLLLQAQREILDTLAHACGSSLVFFEVDVYNCDGGEIVEEEEMKLLESAIFSLPSIRGMKVTFHSGTITSSFVSRMVSQCSGLGALGLFSENHSMMEATSAAIHIQSPSLKILCVDHFCGSQTLQFSLDCPQLECYICSVLPGPRSFLARQWVKKNGTRVSESCFVVLKREDQEMEANASFPFFLEHVRPLSRGW